MFNSLKIIIAVLKLGEIKFSESIKITSASVILVFLEIFSVGFLAILLIRIISNESKNIDLNFFEATLSFSSLTLISILLISVISKFFLNYFLNKIIYKISNEKQFNIRIKYFKLFSNLDFLKFQEKSPNTYITLLGNHIKTYGSALSAVLIFFGEILFLFIILIFLLILNIKITLFLTSFFVLFLLIYSKIKILNPIKVGYETKESYKGLYNFILNFFNSYKEIKIYNKYETIHSNLKNYSNKIFKSDLKNNLLSILPKQFIELVIMIFFSILLFSTIKFNFKLFENIEYFTILIASIIRLLPFFVQILRLQNILRYSQTFIDEIIETIDYLNTYQIKKNNSEINFENNFEQIDFKKINFSYNEKKIIEDCNLKIKLNETILIKGESGSGKTTLINIICNFIEPQSWEVSINGNSISKETTFKNLFAYVPQDKFVFEGEVWKNISLEYEKNRCNLDKIKEVLKLARLDIKPEFILFPNGQNLSGGQKQRLIIARALYFSKKIIIFDESTNELDQENEYKIINDIKKIKDISVVIISHKKTIMSLCDIIYNLENKKLILEKKS